ncbi:YiiD C-terminal domain-containing protein [uncultured Desulfobulbus sp.]|uniref:YiiD C-terminal domain-containing protein n=1 Tax=uncultured Desulfobulbus sp. TaxID=239745 RepID=UPI0029C6C2F9|nr:YiiD C-terminal domain-containing protein [uncultured Desulfobulbus sp.]
MDITQIPFNAFVEIHHFDSGNHKLALRFKDHMKNHLGTFHASAQFALAEACSGCSLQQHFPHLANVVVPVLRKSEIKFKKPAESDIHAEAGIDTETKEQFEQHLAKKGRATITVPVDIKDENGTITMSGVFEWFVQKIN